MDNLAPRAHVRLSLPAGLTRHLEFAADIYVEGLDSIAGFLQRFSAAAAEEGKCQRITTLATRRVETSDHWTEYTAAARQLRIRCTQRSARFFGLLRAPPRAVALVSQPNPPTSAGTCRCAHDIAKSSPDASTLLLCTGSCGSLATPQGTTSTPQISCQHSYVTPAKIIN